MNRVSPHGGFTLVELVMIIVIIGVLAVAVGPRFFSVTAYSERFYNEEVLNGLRYAHRVAESSNCAVRFNLTSTGFQLNQDSNCFSNAAPNFNQNVFRPSEADVPYINTEKPASLIQSGTVNPMFFQPDGKVFDSASSQTAVTISLTGSEVISTIQIDGYSGYVNKM